MKNTVRYIYYINLKVYFNQTVLAKLSLHFAIGFFNRSKSLSRHQTIYRRVFYIEIPLFTLFLLVALFFQKERPEQTTVRI